MEKKFERCEKPTLENLEVVGRGQIGGNCVVDSTSSGICSIGAAAAVGCSSNATSV
jgi:hypothetical protein